MSAVELTLYGAIGVTSVVLLAFLSALVVMLVYRVPYAPTPTREIEKIIAALRIEPGARVYDLGCGDGRVVRAAARAGARAVGYEVSPWLYLVSRVKSLGKPRAKIRFGDFSKADLSDAGAVFVFLLDLVLPDVVAQLDSQLEPGTRVVSYGFPLPGWKPDEVIATSGKSKIYTYQKS